MEKQIILITGASSGMGYETARILAQQGHRVYGAARRVQKIEELAQYGVQPLKFWWLIQKVGYDKWSEQANGMIDCTAYLQQELTHIGWPCWRNEYSNTVFFKRPSPEVCRKYNLALGYDEHFGGELAHVVVMQHVTKAKIDGFIKELK